jgi:hypothetical protein
VADTDGRFVGTVLASDVVAAIETERDGDRAAGAEAGAAAYGPDERNGP